MVKFGINMQVVHPVAKLATNASGAIWWPNLQPIQEVSLKSISNYSSWEIYSSYGLNTLGPLCLWQCLRRKVRRVGIVCWQEFKRSAGRDERKVSTRDTTWVPVPRHEFLPKCVFCIWKILQPPTQFVTIWKDPEFRMSYLVSMAFGMVYLYLVFGMVETIF